MTELPIASLVWPACPTDPDSRTSLSVDELVGGGGVVLRRFVTDCFARGAAADASAPKEWVQSSLDHLRDFVGDHAGGVEIAASALQLVLAYIDHLEEAAGPIAQGERRA